jgi:hypothetical protein
VEGDDVELKPGTRLRSAVDATEVVVVRAPTAPVDLRCGGQPMVAATDAAPAGGGSIDAAHNRGSQLGKRYADPDTRLEVLCTKPGDGSLALGDEPLHPKDAKPLPSSD